MGGTERITGRRGPVGAAGPARHEWPEIDDAALVAARAADRVLAAARERGADRWARYFAEIPDQLRDDAIGDLRTTAMRARAAYGPKDSVRDAVPAEMTEPLLDSIDRLLRVLARRAASGSHQGG